MRYISVAVLVATACLAHAQPHRAQHRHVHAKRDPSPVVDIVHVPGPTVVVCELNGASIPEEDCLAGIKNGTLVWPDNTPPDLPSSSYSVVVVTSTSTSSFVAPTPTTSSTTSSSTEAAPTTSSSSSSSSSFSSPSPSPSSSEAPPPPSSTSAEATSSSSSSSVYSSSPSSSYEAAAATSVVAASAPSASSSAGFIGSATGIDADFPNGELDCSTFPSAYGAVAVDWLGLDGWTGVQNPAVVESTGYSNIETLSSGGCTEGSFCSYACPAGYQKLQWPILQGLTGQSVGGILCKDGKLYRTSLSSTTLCGTGTQAVSVKIQNNLESNSAVCRTDYPGTESETIPLNTEPGNTYPLTCPDGETYYTWEGKVTSAQYYVNPAGTSVQDACQWGSAGSNIGNWAPVNLGVGYTGDTAWLSIMANAPTNPDGDLGFSIEIQGDDINGSCKYENGQYCTESGCNDSGCTVAVTSGTATYVFS